MACCASWLDVKLDWALCKTGKHVEQGYAVGFAGAFKENCDKQDCASAESILELEGLGVAEGGADLAPGGVGGAPDEFDLVERVVDPGGEIGFVNPGAV